MPHGVDSRTSQNWSVIFSAVIYLLALILIPFSSRAIEGHFSLSLPLKIRWEFETDRTINLTPATEGNTVYLPLTAGRLLSLNVPDGRLLWKEEMGGEFSAAPLADEGRVYVASESGTTEGRHLPRAKGAIRALANKSGVTLWMRTLQSPLRGSLASNQTTLFGGAADGRVYAFRKTTGEIVWSTQLDTTLAAHPVVNNGRLYIGGGNGVLYTLDQETGKAAWRYRTQGAIRGPVSVAEQTVFFGSADSRVYALREFDGRLRWRSRTGAEVQAVTHTPRGLIVASLDNFVYLLSTRRGDRLWKRQLAGRIASQPLVTEEGALLTPLSGDAGVVLDLRDGKFMNNLPVGEGNNTAASPVLAGRRLLLTTRRGLIAYAPSDAESDVKSQTQPVP